MLARFWMILTVVMVLTTPVVGDEIKIASWNIENLGQTKAGLRKTESSIAHKKNKTIAKIAHIINAVGIDLIAIQEVQDAKFDTLPELLKALGEENWQYIESERTGRGTQQEQYAIFFDHRKLKLEPENLKPEDATIHLYDDMEDNVDHFSRDPGYASFSYKGFKFTIITCHLDPKQHAAYETERLDDVYQAVKRETDNLNISNIFVLGDFNLEDGPDDIAFQKDGLLDKVNYPKMKAVLEATDDTTLGGEDDETTFDNILFESNQFKLKKSGVYRFDDELGYGYDKKISDHYPVWAIFEIPEVDNDSSAE